jgi:hypothetical protein
LSYSLTQLFQRHLGWLDRVRAASLAETYPNLSTVRLEAKGRGRALKRVWSQSGADFLSYMDVDLSTDLGALPSLIEAVGSGESDLAVGSRLLPASVTRRSWRREAISRCYNRLVKAAMGTRFSDAQCGFKAISARAAKARMEVVQDTGWFLDSELLGIAERCGYRILELPVRWTKVDDSRVRIASTAWDDLRGLARLRRNLRLGRYDHLIA